METQQTQSKFNQILASDFQLTAEEAARMEGLVFDQTPDAGARFANSFKQCLLPAYADGEIDLEEMLRVMRNCSLMLEPTLRLYFLGSVTEYGLKTKPKNVPKKRGNNGSSTPPWLQRAIVLLVEVLRENFPNENLEPSNDLDSSIHNRLINILVALQICSALPAFNTLQKWRGKAKKSQPN